MANKEDRSEEPKREQGEVSGRKERKKEGACAYDRERPVRTHVFEKRQREGEKTKREKVEMTLGDGHTLAVKE